MFGVEFFQKILNSYSELRVSLYPYIHYNYLPIQLYRNHFKLQNKQEAHGPQGSPGLQRFLRCQRAHEYVYVYMFSIYIPKKIEVFTIAESG